MTTDRIANFRQRLRSREPLIGTWIKTPSYIVSDVLSRSSLDTLCLDAEHAPFDRSDLDQSVMIGRQMGMPMLVRIPSNAPHHVLNALDIGAAGVLAPHITSRATAEAFARACHFGPGGRGFSGSARAAEFTGRKMHDHIEFSNAGTTVIAQIEDAEALDVLDEIAAVEDIDCLFIGRADLAVSLGTTNASDAVVMKAAERIAEAGRKHGKAVGSFVSDLTELSFWRERGISFFLLESDQVFLLRGAAALVDRFTAEMKR